MNTQQYEEKYASTLHEYKGTILDFRVDEITLPNGKKSFREYIRHKGAVAVIPVDGDGNVYLVKQFRYAAGRMTLEIPAGKLDADDTSKEAAALRELREETGFTADTLIPIGEYIGSPAISSESIWLYFAEGLSQGEQELDDDEFLNVVKMPLSELCSLVMKGGVPDGKTSFAALWVERYLSEKYAK